MASERVERRAARAAAALDAAAIPYAIVGGNAVRVWVATRDRGAVRSTRAVDILVRPDDVDRVTAALGTVGFRRENLRSLIVFVDPADNDRKAGVHLLLAGQKVRPSSLYPAPAVDERVRAIDEDYWVATIPALLRLKLTAFRPKDQAHVIDMLEVGLIDDAVAAALPEDLRARLAQLKDMVEDDDL